MSFLLSRAEGGREEAAGRERHTEGGGAEGERHTEGGGAEGERGTQREKD